MDNQFDHKASGVRAAFGSFGPNEIDLAKKKCIISSAAFFHAKFQIRNNSRARHVKVYILPLCVRFNDQNSKEIENETSPTGKKNT